MGFGFGLNIFPLSMQSQEGIKMNLLFSFGEQNENELLHK